MNKEQFIKELKKINKLPEYLLMENVKAIFADSNKDDLNQWLKFLESIGYKNGSNIRITSDRKVGCYFFMQTYLFLF